MDLRQISKRAILAILIWDFFFKPFSYISRISQNGLKKLFTILNGNFNGFEIDSEESNLSYFDMIFCFKAFPDISHISQNFLKKLFYNNTMATYTELMEIPKTNDIRGYSNYTKSILIDLLVIHGNNKQEKMIKDIDPKYNF